MTSFILPYFLKIKLIQLVEKKLRKMFLVFKFEAINDDYWKPIETRTNYTYQRRNSHVECQFDKYNNS